MCVGFGHCPFMCHGWLLGPLPMAEIKHQSCVVWQDILCPAPWVSGGNATNNTNGIVRLSSKGLQVMINIAL